MGNAFFSGWALWQKLVFIMGLGIVMTVLLGGAKLGYTHWRLHKYSAVAERERQEQAIHREMSQRRRGPGVPRKDEIPFGVRAIERGVQVEGVWQSRSNTPEPSIHHGSTGGSMWDFLPGRNTQPDIEKQHQQQPQHRSSADRSASESITKTPRHSSSAFERAVSAERLSSIRTSRDSTPHVSLEKPSKSRHPPPSFAKYSGNPSLYRHSSTLNTLEGIDAIHRASTILRSEAPYDVGSRDSYTQSSSDSSDSGLIAGAAPRLLNHQIEQRGRHHSADFDLLNSHRISQAAETGQLTPRARRPNLSIDARSFHSDLTTPTAAENGSYFAIKKSPSPTTPQSANITTPFSAKFDALPASVRRSSMPDVTPFAQFVQTAPTFPRPTSLKSPDGGNTIQQQTETQSECASAPSIPSKPSPPACEGAPPTPPPDVPAEAMSQGQRPSFEKKRTPSQVVRGHGSGFEILKPGSLNPPIPAEHPMEKQRAAPPVTLHNYRSSRSHSRTSSTVSGRKLQKKRRPSIDSQASVESGQEGPRGRSSFGEAS